MFVPENLDFDLLSDSSMIVCKSSDVVISDKILMITPLRAENGHEFADLFPLIFHFNCEYYTIMQAPLRLICLGTPPLPQLKCVNSMKTLSSIIKDQKWFLRTKHMQQFAWSILSAQYTVQVLVPSSFRLRLLLLSY